MANLNLPNIREGGDIRFRIGLEDGGVAVDWSGLEDIRVFLYADAQKRVSGECEIGIDVSDHTVLGCFYSGDDVQYRGINSVLVRAKYQGEIKVYDKPAINIVARTSEATGVVVIDDPVVPVQISVEDVSTSLLNNAIDAAINAAADAEEAAHLVPLQVLEDCVEATGKALEAASKAPYIDETTGNWFVWDAEAGEYVDSGKTARGATGNGIASWSVVESAEDAGNNVVTVTFTDGTSESFNVKNGHTGNGIASIVQTVESPDDAGTNVITITMTNGTVVTFNVKNGSKGSPGVAQAAYKSVDTLPTASAQTMDKIYLTPSGTSGVYNMSYTEFDGSAYSWQDLGTTAIQLSDYATKEELSQLEHKVGDLNVSASSSDLDFEDGDGNVLARFSGGHIKVKNFDSADVEGISQDTAVNADLEFSDAGGNAVVRFVDGHIKTKNFDSADVGNKNGYQRETYFDTTNDCVQQNASSFTATNPNSYVSQVIYDDHAVLILPDSYTKNGTPTRLIIFCKQGNSQITDSSNPIMVSNAMGNIFHFLVSRGYAVLAADGVPDGLSSALELDDTRVSGNYVAVQSTRKAYDYVIKNYNIYDDGAFIFGYSQGGIYAQNVIDLSGIPFLGCAMVSPTLSMRYHLWDLSTSKTIGGVNWTRTSRLNIARLYGFDAVTTNAELLALQFDKEKVAGYDPWNRNVENPYEGFTQTSQYGSNLWALPTGADIDAITMKKKIGCPTKIWAAENDGTLGTDVTKVFVKAARNAGQVCDLHLYNDGNHHIFQNTYQNPAITTFSDQGNTYNLYAITYEIASFFHRLGGLPLNLN